MLEEATSLNDLEVFTLDDADPERLQYGGVGLYTWGNAGISFDDVRVEALTP